MKASRGNWSERLAWAGLGLLLVTGLPLFLCMPLWGDVTLYDICARNVLRGGVHYRDVFDTNLPGMVWCHAAIRWLLGWRSETIRGVDFVIVSAIVWLLVGWLRPLGLSRAARVWTAVALYAFYFSTSEWCHCQRDVWMLLPALGALSLRRRQLGDLAGPDVSLRRTAVRATAEGLCWGAAFWIKPFVAVPALACWLVTAAIIGRAPARRARLLAVDAAGVAAGGLIAGGLGTAWLWRSGTWPYFWEVFRDWNPGYYSRSAALWVHTACLFLRFLPWSLVHLAAVPVAITAVGQVLRRSRVPPSPESVNPAGQPALLAAFYLGWLVQAAYVQMPFDYILAPPVLLALPLIAGRGWPLNRSPLGRVILTGFVVLAAVEHPLLRGERLAVWSRCWREGSTAEIRDRLTLHRNNNTPDWVELERVAEYLRGQRLRDGELTCYDNSPHPLYLELDLKPSTRFLHFNTVLAVFPSHHDQVRRELAASGQRYVVSDLEGVGLSPVQAAEGSGPRLALPPDFPRASVKVFPWSEPIVFRAGRYLVHRVTRPVGRLLPEADMKDSATANPPITHRTAHSSG